MNCEVFQRVLAESVEQRRAPQERVRRHAAECPLKDCREAWENFVLLEQAISNWKTPLERVDFTDRVLHDYESTIPLPSRPHDAAHAERQPKRTPSRQSRLAWGACGISVACALLAVIAMQPSARFLDPQRHEYHGAVAESTPPATGPHATQVTEKSELQDIETLYASWISDASTRVTDTVAFVLPVDDATSAAPDQEADSGWLGRWQQRLKPWEQKLDDTLQRLDNSRPDQTGLPPHREPNV